MINDYFRLRTEMGLSKFPDEMVDSVGCDVETRILMGKSVSTKDIAWLIEAAARAEPKSHSAVMTDGLKPREAVG